MPENFHEEAIHISGHHAHKYVAINIIVNV